MRLLLDMDGPLADFDLRFWELCQRHNLDMNITGLDDPSRRRFMTDNIVDDQQRKFARSVVDRTHWFAELPVVKGAVDGVLALQTLGVDVWVVTKPLEANPHCRDDKAKWLRTHFGTAMEHKLIITPDKSLIHGAVLLDDAPKLSWFSDASWRPVIFPSVFNGPGSEWGDVPSWGWSDPLSDLIGHLKGTA